MEQAGASERHWGAFVPGVPDVSLFPHAIWAKLTAKRWRNPAPDMLTYAHGGGYMPLRRALAEHLRLARSVCCEPEQVLITSGIHQSVSVQIGRASCRERVCQYVSISGVAVSLKQKKK